MLENIQNLKNEALAQIMEASSLSDIDNLRVAYLGRNGKLNNLIKTIKNLSIEERKKAGLFINESKKVIESSLAERKNKLQNPVRIWFDPTIPGKKPKIGHLHPTTLVIKEMFEIFKHMGFSIYEGPEIETDEYNYERLNLPKDHPARSLQDALFIEDPEIVLRTHTSSVEARALASLTPPFRLIVAGKCYRYESVNVSNNIMFYHFQGIALQKGISMAHLKGTLYYFAKELYGKNREFRFRCKYYPEVEPGGGMDIDCSFCKKKGCSICKQRGWLEILGCGMIHPNVLKNFGYNPKNISGFAFGMGLDRLVMDRFKITDIRSLYNGDINYQI